MDIQDYFISQDGFENSVEEMDGKILVVVKLEVFRNERNRGREVKVRRKREGRKEGKGEREGDREGGREGGRKGKKGRKEGREEGRKRGREDQGSITPPSHHPPQHPHLCLPGSCIFHPLTQRV